MFLCSVCMDRYGSLTPPTESVFRANNSDGFWAWKFPGNGLKFPPADSPTSGAEVTGVILRRSGE